MRAIEDYPGGAHRLGDAIRVVVGLRDLDDDEWDLVARLLSGPEGDRGTRASDAARPAPMSPAARSPTERPPRRRHRARMPLPSARRHRARISLPRAADLVSVAADATDTWLNIFESMTRRLVWLQRRWLAWAAGAAAAVVALAVAGMLPAWLQQALIGGAIGAAAVFGSPALLAWRRSPQLRSAARRAAAGVHGGQLGSGGAPAELRTARWTAPKAADPLLPRRCGRSFAVALASAAAPGALDARSLVEDVARRRPRRAPALLARQSVRRGVQLIVDRGAALDPLRDDIALLARWLAEVASRAGLQQLGFRGDPRYVTGVRRPAYDPDEPTEYRSLLPRAGSAVVVVCDLGIGRPRFGPAPPAPAAWRAHDRLVRQAGCRALYLVPYPPERWPPALAGRLAIVQWREGLRLSELTAGARRP